MQHDIVPEKMIFDILTPRVRGDLWAEYLLLYNAAFRDSFYFDMQHDNVLKKLNFDMTPSPSLVGWGGGGVAGKHLLPCDCIS